MRGHASANCRIDGLVPRGGEIDGDKAMSRTETKVSRNSKMRARSQSRPRDRDDVRSQWVIRRYRVGTLNGPAYIDFKFPTEGDRISQLCVPASDLRHTRTLLDKFANLLPIFPADVGSADADRKQFIQELVSSTSEPLELVPSSTGFIDQNTFVTHGEIIRGDGAGVLRPRLPDELQIQALEDLKGSLDGSRRTVLKLARYSTYLAFAIGVALAACLPSYVKLRPDRKKRLRP